jgi:phosphoribosyl 1,2-cyclic phosphodiesterase
MCASAGPSLVVEPSHPRVSIFSLASGSSGNALLIKGCSTTVLIDCGLSTAQLRSRLDQCGSSIGEIDIVFLTHEHTDHVRGVGEMRSQATEIVTSRGTANAIRLDGICVREVAAWQPVDFPGGKLTPIPVSHDAAEPLAVHLEIDGLMLTVATDLGKVTPEVAEALRNSDLAVLEANHDLEMLRNGPYPQYLKQRVLSRKGHISNDECAKALATASSSSDRLRSVWLAHLSTTNNLPSLASDWVRRQNPGLEVAALPRTRVLGFEIMPSEISRVKDVFLQTSLW